ncbi:MAG: hypothetical protein ACI9LY_000076 [Arenicella sp.]|jgi:hypothetical protein
MNNSKKLTPISISAGVGGLVAGIALTLIFVGGGESNSGQAASTKKQPLYWVAPMDRNYRRDTPGKSPMGMDLIPVYEGGENANDEGPSTISISPDVINNLGVRTGLDSTNGPGVEADEHGEEPSEEPIEEDGHADLPELAFEASSGDNNKNKAFGGRVAYAMLPSIEIGTSYYSATYDDDETLDFTAQGIDINLIGSHYLVRGEYIDTQTDGLEVEEGETEIHTFKRDGWYLQSTLQTGKIWSSLAGTELVLEYAQTNQLAEASRWMVGVNYWLDARSVVKIAYDDTDVEEGEDDQRFTLQLSYGF